MLNEVSFVPSFEEINVDYDPGTTLEVAMHDGSRLRLKKLEEDYDPMDRIRAVSRLMEAHAKGDVLTGVFYIDAKAPSFIDMLNVTDQPLASLPDGRAAVEFCERLYLRRSWNPTLRKVREGWATPCFLDGRMRPSLHGLLCPHGQDHAEASAAADHLFVGFGDFFQWELLDHRTDSGERAELHSVLGIGGDSRSPSLQCFAATNELNGRDRDWIRTGAYHHQFAVTGEAIEQRGHCFRIGSGGENDAGAAELLQLRGGIASSGIHVVSGS